MNSTEIQKELILWKHPRKAKKHCSVSACSVR